MVKIIFVGDILLHSSYNSVPAEKGPFFVFEKIFPALQMADVRFGNLESVLSKKGVPIDGKGCITGDEAYIGSLSRLNFDVLSLANNHTFDFGVEAYEDMSLKLHHAGIRTVGAGRTLHDSRKMVTFSVNDLSIGFLSYSSRSNNGRSYATATSFGVTPLDDALMMEDIRENRKHVDCLVVSLHWGIEHSLYPTPDQISLAHKLVDAGVNIVAGNHPQIMQGIEHYRQGIIMYSLGNFCHADYHWKGPQKTYHFQLKEVDRESIMVEIDFEKSEIVNINVIPVWINDVGQPVRCEGENYHTILQKLSERSEAIKRPDFVEFWNEFLIKRRVGSPIRIWWQSGNLIHKIRNFRLSQIKSLFELLLMYIQVRFSRSPSKWQMLNPRNDKKPRPFCGKEHE